MESLDLISPILRIVVTTILSFATIFILCRILGKKTIAQMQLIDYVIGITIGSIAAQMTIDPEIKFYYFIIAMVIFALLDLIIGYFERKANFLKFVLRGKPQVIIEDGKINYEELKKSKLDVNELLSLCRQKNFFDINDVAYAVFETNGELSILPKSSKTPTTIGNFDLPLEDASLSSDVVIDGKIIYACLEKIGKSKEWLLKNLNTKSEEEIKNIILASYEEKEQKIIIHYKKNTN